MYLPASITSIEEDALGAPLTIQRDIYYAGTEEMWNKIKFETSLPDGTTVHFGVLPPEDSSSSDPTHSGSNIPPHSGSGSTVPHSGSGSNIPTHSSHSNSQISVDTNSSGEGYHNVSWFDAANLVSCGISVWAAVAVAVICHIMVAGGY